MPNVPKPQLHMKTTAELARKLPAKAVYDWLMTIGYYPESYVLPPCFSVDRYPVFGTVYFPLSPTGRYSVQTSNLLQIEFPKSNFSDRTFSIIDPKIHCDISYELASNWKHLLSRMFHPANLVCSYSFPIPLDSKHPGTLGKLRSGRMIYEFIEMAENDIASEAYRYSFLVIADIKNCYPSIYTHSLSWAIHGIKYMKSRTRWHNYSLLGNRLDKLFQRANADHTTGIPIGPGVSDVASEVLLAQVDTTLSRHLKPDKCLAVRFKDDYRILCATEEDAKRIIKSLQFALADYGLTLSDDKTTYHKLPDGIFRPWASRYHAVNPGPKKRFTYKRLRELYLAVVAIERDVPGTGVIDRFLADIVTKDYKPNFAVSRKSVAPIISMLLMLPGFRIKSFPKTLGVIEAILRSMNDPWYTAQIGQHLGRYLDTLASSERESRYLIVWILYFLRSNRLDRFIRKKYRFRDPLLRSVQSGRSNVFSSAKDFKLALGIIKCSNRVSLLQHLDVFCPQ